MKKLRDICEAIHDHKTPGEVNKMNYLDKSLSSHYHFDAKDTKPPKSNGSGYWGHDDSADIKPMRRYDNSPSKNQHIEAIHEYTQGNTNSPYLWKRHKGEVEPDDFFEKDIKKLNTALHYHKTPHQFHVFSATRHDPRINKDENNVVHHPAFMSTSINKDFAKRWGGRPRHVLKIKVPKGSPGAYVEHLSACQGQREFILPSGHNLKYHKTDTKTTGFDTQHIHHMTLMSKEEQ